MTKTTLFSILGLGVSVVFIVVLAGKAQESGEEVIVDETSEEILVETQGKKMSFSEFLKQDADPYECTVRQYIDEAMTQSTEGKVFLDAGRIRGDFATTVQEMTVDTSMIVRDGFVYTWTNMSPMGFKTVAIQTEGDENTETSGNYSWNAEQIGDYDCVPWVLDETKFELPSTVTFQEI